MAAVFPQTFSRGYPMLLIVGFDFLKAHRDMTVARIVDRENSLLLPVIGT
jgi:hypothetical protein